MDYELIYRAGKLSVRKEPYKKNIRVARAFGDDYAVDKIKERIKIENAVRVPFPEMRSKKVYKYKGRIRNRRKATGIRRIRCR